MNTIANSIKDPEEFKAIIDELHQTFWFGADTAKILASAKFDDDRNHLSQYYAKQLGEILMSLASKQMSLMERLEETFDLYGYSQSCGPLLGVLDLPDYKERISDAQRKTERLHSKGY